MRRKVEPEKKATFIIKIISQKNGTWQGKITYADENKTRYFRSMLEMLRLIEEVTAASKDNIVQWKVSNE